MLLVGAAPAGAAAHRCADADGDPAAIGALRTIEATVCLVNAERTAHGRAPLRWNTRLWAAADDMARELARGRFFSHTTPSGRDLLDRVQPTGYTTTAEDWLLGENLAWGAGRLGTPASAVDGWMHSPGHRRNVLDRDFEEIGVAVSAGIPRGQALAGTFYVADFGREVQPRPKRARTRAATPRTRRALSR